MNDEYFIGIYKYKKSKVLEFEIYKERSKKWNLAIKEKKYDILVMYVIRNYINYIFIRLDIIKLLFLKKITEKYNYNNKWLSM